MSYSGDPSNSSRDGVRFLIGDTDDNDEQLSDQEIDWLVTENSGVYLAAAAACENIAAKYARRVDASTAGVVRVNNSQKQEHYLTLAKTLRTRGAMKNLDPFAGGISKGNKDTYEDDADRVEPAFTRELHENPSRRASDDDDRT